MKKLAAILFAVTALWNFTLASPTPVEVEGTDSYHLVRHAGGETQVPNEPERIVTMGSAYFASVVALGLIPLGTAVYTGGTLQEVYPVYLYDVLENVSSVGSWSEVNLEAILAVEPDLILASPWHFNNYPQLAKVAPTVVVDDQQDYYGLEDIARVGSQMRLSRS